MKTVKVVSDKACRNIVHVLQCSAVQIVSGMFHSYSSLKSDIVKSLVRAMWTSFRNKAAKLFSATITSSPESLTHISPCIVCILQCIKESSGWGESEDVVQVQSQQSAVFALELVQVCPIICMCLVTTINLLFTPLYIYSLLCAKTLLETTFHF